MSAPEPPSASPQPAQAPHCYRHPGRETWIRCQRCDRPICPDCMRPASVGYQCPECVQEGARSVRSPRSPYGGAVVRNPQTTTLALIAVNVAVWLGILASGGGTSTLLQKLALLPASSTYRFPDGHVGVVDGVSGGAYWELGTSAFTHVEVWHIGFNMLALWFLGPNVEQLLGRVRFLAVYFVSILTSGAAVMLLSPPHGQTLGASGAIFGLLGALVVVGLKVGANMQQIWFWLVINLVFTFTGSGISWQGHIGGLVGGALAAVTVVYAGRARRTAVQTAGLTAIAVLALALVAVRAATLP